MKTQKITVIDRNGFEIEVTDLQGAIEQVEYCRGLSQEIPLRFGFERQQYWEDLHQKLQQLKIGRNGNGE